MSNDLVVGKKLWLWKNGNHYVAYDNPYPCYPGGDPLTVGEPIGIAFLRPSVDGTPVWDNANLIAAAPELLEALKDLLNDCINFDGGKLTDIFQIKATRAIAKAERRA